MAEDDQNNTVIVDAYARLVEARAKALGEYAVGSDIANVMREAECCGGCGLPFIPGDMVYADADGGHLHESCGGSEADSFVGGRAVPPHEWQWPESYRLGR